MCSTYLGRVLMTIDTPYADAIESIEVGSFDGICAAAVASAAARDVGQRALALARKRETRLNAIAGELDTTVVLVFFLFFPGVFASDCLPVVYPVRIAPLLVSLRLLLRL
jgi:hypothetical protein